MRRFFGERNDLSALSDAELAALAGNGPGARAAFAELYERHIARIYQFCYLRTGNHHDAEDLTARVFARALAAIDRYEERGAPFVSWLFRIARNLALNWQRDRQRRRIIPFDENIPDGNPRGTTGNLRRTGGGAGALARRHRPPVHTEPAIARLEIR